MKLKFVSNFKYLMVTQATPKELDHLHKITFGSHTDRYSGTDSISYMHKKIVNDNPHDFINNQYVITSGFWASVLALNKLGVKTEITNFNEWRKPISREELKKWISEQDLEFEPYVYQEQGVLLALNFPQCRLLLDTSAGKSFTTYLIALYLLKERLRKGLKVLVLVPRTMLVTQLPSDFKDYSKSNEIICSEIMSKGVERKGANVIVGNIDSVAKKDIDWFRQFGAVIVDEAHKINTEQTQRVMNTLFKMPQLSHITGMSGTFEDKDNGSKEYNEYRAVTEMSYLGGILQKLYLEDLKKYGTIANLKVNMVKFRFSKRLCEDYYNHPDCQEEGGRFLFESNYIQGVFAYRNIIIQLATMTEDNQVLLYNTKDFCKQMAQECIEYCKKNNIDRDIFIITGDTKKKEREAIVERFNKSNKGILFAMYEILSTGVSIKSLTGIHLVDSTKAFIRVRQSIGRVLRLHPLKDFATVWDYSVIMKKLDPDWGGGRTNSYANHANHRAYIYEKRQFEVNTAYHNIDGRSSFMDEIPRCERPKD